MGFTKLSNTTHHHKLTKTSVTNFFPNALCRLPTIRTIFNSPVTVKRRSVYRPNVRNKRRTFIRSRTARGDYVYAWLNQAENVLAFAYFFTREYLCY